MSHFRKMLFAAAAVASFIGTSNTANAQANPFVCSTSFSPLVVRVEGLRELVGDIVITCTGGNSIGTDTARIVSIDTVPTPDVVSTASGVVAAPGTGTPGQVGVGGSYTAIANPFVPAINIQVTIPGTRITNRVFSNSNLTDALLFIDEPANPIAGPSVASQNLCSQSGSVCTSQNYFFTNGIATGSGYTSNGNPINVYQAQYGVGGGFIPNEATVTFVGVPIVQPGTFPNAGSRVYRIKNIRVQVANSFQVNGQIQAVLAIQNPPANLVLNNSQGVIGFVQRGLLFDTVTGGPYAQCLGWNLTSGNAFQTEAASPANSLLSTGAVRFTEAYGVAFKRRGFGGVLDVYDAQFNPSVTTQGQTDPRVNYNNESGFYNTSFPGQSASNILGVASNGTRLRARFVGVPAGVRLYVSAQPATAADGYSSGATGRIPRNSDNTSGFGLGQGSEARNAAFAVSTSSLSANGDAEGFSANTSYVYGVSTPAGGSAGVQGRNAIGWSGLGAAYGSLQTSSVQFLRVPIGADGSGTFFWEVLRADDNVIDAFSFLVAVAFERTTNIVSDASLATAVQASGNFAPIATTGGTGYPSIPSFILTQPEVLSPLFEITNCATNLLYPFVSSVTGFNTGIAVTNASKDPFGTVNETGICRVFFYGTTAGGGVDPAAQTFSKSVPSGQVATFNLLFGGPEYGIQPVAGFQGYVIISCNFRWAHGFAFVSDPSNLQTAHGYLALILDTPGLRRNTRGSTSEALDN